MRSIVVICIGLLALLLVSSACNLLGSAADNGTLKYDAPVELTVPLNQSIPGTDVTYLGKSDRGAGVRLGSQTATKQTADSLDWKGMLAPGVDLNLNGRIVSFDEQSMKVVGVAHLTITEVNPQPATVNKSATEYKIPFTYILSKGDKIPGTTIVYQGSSDQGAEFAGAGNPPFRKVADSISWQGNLRNNVTMQLDGRVGPLVGDKVTIGGTATIGIQR
ncbi:MAG: hypothetical protein EXR62_11570 [Chloroflexi bacterium]|nr:hypothetical protein [Chloroflexota bacterium]